MSSRFFEQMGAAIIVHGAVQAAPGANAVFADTGAIPQGGDVWFLVHISNDSTGEIEFEIQHRNAANSANVEVMRVAVPTGSTIQLDAVFQLVANERVRVVNLEAFAASTNGQASIFGSHI